MLRSVRTRREESRILAAFSTKHFAGVEGAFLDGRFGRWPSSSVERPVVYSGFHRLWTRTLAWAGGKLERLSRILGHSCVGVTEAYYAHLDLTDLAEDADLVMAARRWEEGP
jgi:integrase